MSTPTGRFAERSAVEAGGSSGTGQAIASALPGQGPSVVVADVVADAGAHTAELVRAAGGTARLLRTDVSARDDVQVKVAPQVRAMRAQSRGGSVMTIASTNAFRPQRHQPAYAASKHGVLGLTRAATVHHAGDGIRVGPALAVDGGYLAR